MIFPDKESIARTAALAGIEHASWMQDWPIEVSDAERLEEFVTLLTANAHDWQVTFHLLDLVLDSARRRADLAAWTPRLTDALVAACAETKHPSLRERLESWACFEVDLETDPDDAFEVTPLARAVLGRVA